MVVVLNSTLQVLLKTFQLKQQFPINEYIYGSNIEDKLFLLESVWFCIYHCFNRFLYVYHATCYRTKTCVQISYRNPMFCTYISYKRRGQFFGSHSRIFFLNNVGDTIFLNSIGKMSHIFGPKLDIVSQPYMTVLVFLSCSAALFLRS